MRQYELVVIARPVLTDAELDSMIENITKDLSSKSELEDLDVHRWGKRSLAYPIDKFREGHYLLFRFGSDGHGIVEAEKKMRINDGVLRFLAIRRDEEMKREHKLRSRYNVKEALKLNRFDRAPEPPPSEKPAADAAATPAEKPAEQVAVPAEASSEVPAEKTAETAPDQVAEKPAEKTTETAPDQVTAAPAEETAAAPVTEDTESEAVKADEGGE